MSLRFLAPSLPDSTDGLALVRYGERAEVFDEQVLEICQTRLTDSLGRPPLRKNLESFLGRIKATSNENPQGLGEFRLFIGFHIPNLQYFNPLQPDFQREALKGIGSYVKMETENYVYPDSEITRKRA